MKNKILTGVLVAFSIILSQTAVPNNATLSPKSNETKQKFLRGSRRTWDGACECFFVAFLGRNSAFMNDE